MKSIKLKWRILRKKLPYPTTTQVEWTGSEVSPTWSGLDPSISISGDTSATEPGEYTVVFTPDDNHCWMDETYTPYETTWELVRTIINLDGIPAQDGTLSFNGEAQTPSWTNYDPTKLTLEVTAQTSAGTYTATFTPKQGYAWPDGSAEAKQIPWTIEQIAVTPPSVTSSTPYTGTIISVPITGYDANTMTLLGDTEATDAGSYTLRVALKSTNYKWTEGTVVNDDNEFVTQWAIGLQTVNAPTVTGNLTYTGSSLSPIITNGDYLTVTGDTSGIDADTYTLYFVPQANYAWADGVTVDAQGRYVVTWVINPAIVTPPTLSATSVSYTGTSIDAPVTGFDSNTMTMLGGANGTAVGSYSTRIAIKDTNHKWPDGTAVNADGEIVLDWAIEALLLHAPTATTTIFTYNESLFAPRIMNTDHLVVSGTQSATDAGEYKIFYTPEDNYAWHSSVETDEEGRYVITWTIEQATAVPPTLSAESVSYTGDSIAVPLTGFDESIMSMSGATSGTDCGQYTALVELIDKDNYKWTGTPTLNSDGQLEYNWSISPLAIGAPAVSNTNLTYNGEEQGPTITNADHTVITGVQSTTDAGDYTIYFVPESNYKWRGTVMTDSEGRYVVTWSIGQIDSTITLDKTEVELIIEDPRIPGILTAEPTELNITGIGEDYAQYVTVETNIPEGFDVTCDPEGIVEVEVLDVPDEEAVNEDEVSV